MIRFGRFLCGSILWLLMLAVSAYLAFSVYYCAPLADSWRVGLALAVAVATGGPLVLARKAKHRLLLVLPTLVVVTVWFASLKPKQDANWSPDVAVLPSAEIDGSLLTVHNIRNFNYRSDTDFDVRYYDKTYDLDTLQTVDLFLSYWGSEAIAHTIMSFGFEGGDQLAISIETRKEVGEEYSAVQGFFKKFELTYVVADERDVIGVRVNHRNEDVYLYRLRPGPSEVRKILLDYMKTINELNERPQFYNALLTNCTTSILPHLKSLGAIHFNWALIANGSLDHWRYSEGVWGFDIPFVEFRRRSKVNDKVRAAGDAADFSVQIRQGLPSIKPEL